MAVKNSDAVGTCDLAAPICLEMWSLRGLKSPPGKVLFLRWRWGYFSLPMIGLLLARACLENCLDLSLQAGDTVQPLWSCPVIRYLNDSHITFLETDS
jgi:hypothetical protein